MVSIDLVKRLRVAGCDEGNKLLVAAQGYNCQISMVLLVKTSALSFFFFLIKIIGRRQSHLLIFYFHFFNFYILVFNSFGRPFGRLFEMLGREYHAAQSSCSHGCNPPPFSRPLLLASVDLEAKDLDLTRICHAATGVCQYRLRPVVVQPQWPPSLIQSSSRTVGRGDKGDGAVGFAPVTSIRHNGGTLRLQRDGPCLAERAP